MKKRIKGITILLLFICSNLMLLFDSKNSNHLNFSDASIVEENNPLSSNGGSMGRLIVSFNQSTYNDTVTASFEYHGGIINKQWNNTFTSTSMFAGVMPSSNITRFQGNNTNAIVETDEIIEAQMNYVAIQSGAFNESQYLQVTNPTSTLQNYDDEIQENNSAIFNDANGNQSLLVEFDISSQDYYIITGVNFKYNTSGTGNTTINLSYWGDDIGIGENEHNVTTTITDITNTTTPVWKAVYLQGSSYIIDNDPIIEFNSSDPLDNCTLLMRDTPATGKSRYNINDTGYEMDMDYELIVQLFYEQVNDISLYNTYYNGISGNDYVDAFFVYLNAGNDYEFSLDRTSGTGNLNMRLVSFNPITDNNLQTSSGSLYPEKMTYTAVSSGYHVLLVEPNQAGVDFADYSIKFKPTGVSNSNLSVAVLDTGINANQIFFPNGFTPDDFQGDIVGWQNFISYDSISDDNGHGTFVSSVITGTGKNSVNDPTTVNVYGSYHHFNISTDFIPADNFSLKVFSFNASKPNTNILVNSTWSETADGIDGFWFELYFNGSLVNYTYNEFNQTYYLMNYSIDNIGLYNLYIKYHKEGMTIPVFSFNASTTFYPEYYNDDYYHHTGIANATKIVSMKILNESGKGYTSDLIDSLLSIMKNKSKLHIVSACLSIGLMGDDAQAINAVINEVIKNGTIVVIAAGNSGIEGSNPLSKLGMNKNAIIVGAINDIDQITSYSSMGMDVGSGMFKPDIVAPGGSKLPYHRSVISADVKTNETVSAYGTSISAAIVSSAINLIVQAKWVNWSTWESLNMTKYGNIIKSILLMTASETNLNREDDPETEIDESQDKYSPTRYLEGLSLTETAGLKDEQEGYGRINIQAAIDAMTRYLELNKTYNINLKSSEVDPLAQHVFARRIILNHSTQYIFNVSNVNLFTDLDIYLYENKTDQYGEPVLLTSSRRTSYRDDDFMYFAPNINQTECIVVIKAINGSSNFNFKVSNITNDFAPSMNITEITYIGGSKNTTVLGQQEMLGNSIGKNLTIDTYYFFIEYTDNDTSNAPPQDIFVVVDGKNYTMAEYNPITFANYSEGVIYMSEGVKFKKAGTYEYYFWGTDGLFPARYHLVSNLSITVEFPSGSSQLPYEMDFAVNGLQASSNWTESGTGWAELSQVDIFDDRARRGDILIPLQWRSVYFGSPERHLYPTNYSYQPLVAWPLGTYPNGTLTSPLFNFTNLPNTFEPTLKLGYRVSINTGDLITLDINLNWTGWQTIRTWGGIVGIEQEWDMEMLNLSQYKNNFVQFRFQATINNIFDPQNYKGFMVDYFAIENITNNHAPAINTVVTVTRVSPTSGTKYQSFTFQCEYEDQDENYPEYVYLEIGGNNYSMYNPYGDWTANSTITDPELNNGILFKKSLPIGDFTNRSYKFHVSDGTYKTSTNDYYNKDNSEMSLTITTPLEYNNEKDGFDYNYVFKDDSLEDYYVAGTPAPEEYTAWLSGDNTWHVININDQDMLYGGIGQLNYGPDGLGYGDNWNAKLITRPLRIDGDHDVYLQFTNGDFTALQNEFLVAEASRDSLTVQISTDYGETWGSAIKEFKYDSGDLTGHQKIDISSYVGDVIMVMFTLHSNAEPLAIGIGLGWFLYNITIGYDENTDFIAPTISITSPINLQTINSSVIIKATILDNVGIDSTRTQIYINGESVGKDNIIYDNVTGEITFTWDTTLYTDGLYNISIVVFDKEGNRAELKITVLLDNGPIDFNKWWPYILLIVIAIITALVLYILSEKKGKVWVKTIKDSRVEKSRLSEIKKHDAKKIIQVLSLEEELKRPLTLHCKACKSWFSTDHFDIICPSCGRDKIYAAYNCPNCKKWDFKDTPRQDYYCSKCTPVIKKKTKKIQIKKTKVMQIKDGIRLIRREKEDIINILTDSGHVLRKYEIDKKEERASILD